jgi:CBS domain-containing protein
VSEGDDKAKGDDTAALTAGRLMQSPVVTCSPRARAVDVARRLSERNVGSIPIVEEDGRLVGLVSESDLIDALIEGRDLRGLAAQDVMTRKVLTVTEAMPVADLMNLFQDRFLIRVPVVRDGFLVGVVARRDVILGYITALER